MLPDDVSGNYLFEIQGGGVKLKKNIMLTILFFTCLVQASSSVYKKKSEEIIDINTWLNNIANIRFTDFDFVQKISDGELSTLYYQLDSTLNSINEFQSFIENKKNIMEAKSNLKLLIYNIHDFYERYFNKIFLGDLNAMEKPDIIVILGANKKTLEERLYFSLKIISKHPTIPIILSGGGRDIEVEADVMHNFLIRHNVKNPLYLETDSVDTVGNAVFTSFTLINNKIKGNNILIITSNFHGSRALFLFQKILQPDYKVAVALAPFSGDNLSFLIASELRQQAIAIETILQWGRLPGRTSTQSVKNSCDTLFQMQVRHKLYLFRWDLSHKYKELCQK